MDVSTINPFLSSCEEAFKTMFNIDPQHKAPYLLNPGTTHMWEVSGLVKVSGDETGIVVFRLQKRLAEKAFSKYCVSIDYANRLKADERKKETVERVNAQHLENMKTFLTKKQYAVYVDMLTVATDKHVALFQETAH